MKTLRVQAEWDQEANVWVAISEDVAGLVAEADTEKSLLTKLRVLIAELLDANQSTFGNEFTFEIVYSHTANAVLKQAGLPKKF